jgi:hypothetical protein
MTLAEIIVAEGLSVRAAERLATRAKVKGRKAAKPPRRVNAHSSPH